MTSAVSTDAIDAKLLLSALAAFKEGDFSVRLPIDGTGLEGKIYDTLNGIFQLTHRLTNELVWISATVGREGKVNQRASLGTVSGGWVSCVDSVNQLIHDLVIPSTEVARVIGAVAKGDLSQRMAIAVDDRSLCGEFLHTAQVVNTMVEQLHSFASEVTRVAREVGMHGKLEGRPMSKTSPALGKLSRSR